MLQTSRPARRVLTAGTLLVAVLSTGCVNTAEINDDKTGSAPSVTDERIPEISLRD